MAILPHRLSDGRTIELYLSRRARKNIILRPQDRHSLRLSIPPQMDISDLRRWLQEHEPALRQMLTRATEPLPAAPPPYIWLHGRQYQLHSHKQTDIQIHGGLITLPQADWPRQQTILRRHLLLLAEPYLLPRLAKHAERLQLLPESTALTRARSFWGVCRHRRIRLNWRLVGAPPEIADYVCIHELCHLRHPNHSPDFWSLVERHTPYRTVAADWLKRHGCELFILG